MTKKSVKEESVQERFYKAADFADSRFGKLYNAMCAAGAKKEPRKQIPKLLKLFDKVMGELESLEDDFSIMYKEFTGDVEFTDEVKTRVI